MCYGYTSNKTDVFEMFYNCCYKKSHSWFSEMDESYLSVHSDGAW